MGNQFGGFRQLPPPGTICPICLSTFIVPCQTNCGHWFCAECILRWSETSRIMKTMNCPKCRALITSIAVDNSASRRFTAINIRIWSYNATFEEPSVLTRLRRFWLISLILVVITLWMVFHIPL
ncbi:E3 ubiquitin-protein ligase RNF170-like [Olea europaea var. sylvestris]|uniref:E3 ubiquitin-protein ligase RNF170-like n=1 Tax=Olea europaea var. sylvestris TaxID=158386 RepID=UPI000C1D3933|nr:E3 ubiquitin-protein ligase RNF170-like [Olea europaea var. sylvestris]